MPFSSLWNRLLGKDDTSTLEHRRDDIHDVLAAYFNELVDGFLKAQRFLGDDLEGGGVAPGMAYQQTTPDMTLQVVGGFFSVGGALVDKTSGGPFTSPTFAAPATDPRIDLLWIDAAGVFQITQGVEDPSPVVPADPGIGTVLWEVYLRPSAVALNEIDTQSAGTGYLYRDRRYPVGGGSGSGSGGGIFTRDPDPRHVSTVTLTPATGTTIAATTAIPADSIGRRILRVKAVCTSGTPTGTARLWVESREGSGDYDYLLRGDTALDANGHVHWQPDDLDGQEDTLWWLIPAVNDVATFGTGDQVRVEIDGLSGASDFSIVIEWEEMPQFTDISYEVAFAGPDNFLPYGSFGADPANPALRYLGTTVAIDTASDCDFQLDIQDADSLSLPGELDEDSFTGIQYLGVTIPGPKVRTIPAGTALHFLFNYVSGSAFGRMLAVR